MIITRTPFRVSFAGGGTDLPAFYTTHGHGTVVSATIRRYMYIAIHPYFHDKIRIKYSRTEDVAHADEVEHPLVRECLRRVGVDRGIEIASFADVASGTGLGSSSAFTVGLLHALYAYRGVAVSPQRLASEACDIEINILGEPIGKQDQYAVAYGGINRILFRADGEVEVTPLPVREETRQQLERCLRLYYLGGRRSASQILKEQSRRLNHGDRSPLYDRMLELTGRTASSLCGDACDDLGDILHQGWLLKKKLASAISTAEIDRIYDRARELGAHGGKLLGAGGTGFLLLWHENHEELQKNLGLRPLPFQIDRQGSALVFFDAY